MKYFLLAPLALSITTQGTGTLNIPLIAASASRQIPARDYTTAMHASSMALETLLGEWVKLKGVLDCKGLTFYSAGGLDILTEKNRRSVYYEIKDETAKSIRGQIHALRDSSNGRSRPFIIKFLSPREIELTLLYKNRKPQKAVFQKRRDFRAGVWLIR